jgi:hypothetical protein
MARAYDFARTFWTTVKDGFDILFDSFRDLAGIGPIVD